MVEAPSSGRFDVSTFEHLIRVARLVFVLLEIDAQSARPEFRFLARHLHVLLFDPNPLPKSNACLLRDRRKPPEIARTICDGLRTSMSIFARACTPAMQASVETLKSTRTRDSLARLSLSPAVSGSAAAARWN